MINALSDFLKNSLTAYHACQNVKEKLLANGFQQLLESEDWVLSEEGKYFIERGGSSIIAFTVGALGFEEEEGKICDVIRDFVGLERKEFVDEKGQNGNHLFCGQYWYHQRVLGVGTFEWL